MARAGFWAGTLGFGLGGFLDGILLHQILQWHHLLSLVDGIGDLRAQVLSDGVFHLAMSLLAAVGLWGLWRAWRRGGRPSGALLLGAVLLGFGTWHLIDAVASHWLLGLHRIRLGAANPLAWDLGWLAAFGLAPMALGAALLRRGGPALGGGLGAVAALALGAGLWADRAPGEPFAVVFAPGAGTGAVGAAPAAADARLVAGDPRQDGIVVDAAPAARWSFHRHGALLVGGAGLPPGRLSWSRG